MTAVLDCGIWLQKAWCTNLWITLAWSHPSHSTQMAPAWHLVPQTKRLRFLTADHKDFYSTTMLTLRESTQLLSTLMDNTWYRHLMMPLWRSGIWERVKLCTLYMAMRDPQPQQVSRRWAISLSRVVMTKTWSSGNQIWTLDRLKCCMEPNRQKLALTSSSLIKRVFVTYQKIKDVKLVSYNVKRMYKPLQIDQQVCALMLMRVASLLLRVQASQKKMTKCLAKLLLAQLTICLGLRSNSV